MRRVVAVVSLAVLFLTGAGVLWLAPDGWMVRTLIRRVESVTGMTVDAHDLQLTRTGSTMALRAGPLRVFGADGNRVFTAHAVRLRIDLRHLLLGTIAVEDIDVDEPHVTLTVVNGAIVGVPLPQKHRRGFFRLDVERVHARNGVVEVSVPQQPHSDLSDEGVLHRPAAVRVSGLDIVAVPDGGDEHRVRVSAQATEVLRGDEVVLRGDPLALEVWVGGADLLAIDRVTLPGVAIHEGTLDVVADGVINLRVSSRRRPTVDVDVRGSTGLAGLGPLADVTEIFAGMLAVSARATTDKSGALVVDADGSMRDLFVGKMALGHVQGHLHTLGTDALLTGASWQLGGTVIHGQARGVLSGKLPFHVDASGERFSLYQLFRELHFSSGPWAEALLTGDAEADGALVPFVLAGHARGLVDDIVVANKDVARAKRSERVVEVAGRVDADTDFHADQTSLRFSRGTLTDGPTILAGAAELFSNKARGLTVDVGSPALSLASFRGHIGPLALSATARGHVSVRGPYAHPHASAIVHAHDLVVDRFSLGEGEGRIDATSTTLKLSDVVLHKGRSQYRSQLDLDFAHIPANAAVSLGKPPKLVLDVHLEGAHAEDLRAIIPRPEKDPALAALRELALTGPVGGAVHASGFVGEHSARHVEADAALSGEAGARLYGMNVEGRTLHVRLQRGRIVVDGVR